MVSRLTNYGNEKILSKLESGFMYCYSLLIKESFCFYLKIWMVIFQLIAIFRILWPENCSKFLRIFSTYGSSILKCLNLEASKVKLGHIKFSPQNYRYLNRKNANKLWNMRQRLLGKFFFGPPQSLDLNKNMGGLFLY